jgi:hypothetical protein
MRPSEEKRDAVLSEKGISLRDEDVKEVICRLLRNSGA